MPQCCSRWYRCETLPDSPPIGFWFDISIVLWVIVVLVASMALYIFCWWRQVREDTRKPT
jgi:hypothetical protein